MYNVPTTNHRIILETHMIIMSLLHRLYSSPCTQRYITDLLEEVNMHNCKGVPTPMAFTIAFLESCKVSLVDGSVYRRIMCKLHYLSFTLSDKAFAVSKLSQSMNQP